MLLPFFILARARISPFRQSNDKEPLPSCSVKMNLSAVTEHSGIGAPANNSATDQSVGSSLRLISGRKSMRSLREVTFKHNMRGAAETYRRIPVDDDYLNDSISSVNATVGSDIPNDSFRTPIVAVKGRKRTADGGAGDGNDDDVAVEESPKKARLDLSGFFGIVASPVTMLRNRFTRVKLQCSTPNKAATAKQNVESMEMAADEIENVDASASDKEIEEIVDEEEQEAATSDEAKTSENDEGTGKLDEQSIELGGNDEDDAAAAENEKDISIATEAVEPRRSRCIVM